MKDLKTRGGAPVARVPPKDVETKKRRGEEEGNLGGGLPSRETLCAKKIGDERNVSDGGARTWSRLPVKSE